MSVTDDIARLTEAHLPEDWTDLDKRAVDTARVLAAELATLGVDRPGVAADGLEGDHGGCADDHARPISCSDCRPSCWQGRHSYCA